MSAINQATGSNLDLTVYKTLINEDLNLYPTAYSTRTNDIPNRNSEIT